MKQILLRALAITACVAFSFAGAQAQVITAERAQEIANSFFQNGKQKSAAVRSTAAVSMKKSADSRILSSESSSDAPTFHILTPASGEGFVIVSGEEMENPIIGYSFEGTIDTNDLPVGFTDYMTDIDAQVKALRKYNAANPQKAAAARSAMKKAMQKTNYAATTMGNIVKNLNTATWAQGAPYNNLCYDKYGAQAKTGCGPTAFAILCYYYQWPTAGTGSVVHSGTSASMELGHAYDYANMLSSYSGSYTEAQATAVATLMRDLGWANNVDYGTSNTGFSETAQHLIDHFCFKSENPYNHGAGAANRDIVGNDNDWKQHIKNCLNASYPIPYSSTGDGGRHIFILDGYTDNDYYHFNWGWGGYLNGWYTLETDGMALSDGSNYSNSHRAYFYLIPDATTYTVTATATPSNMGTVSINGGTAGSTVTANLMQGVTATLTAHPAQGYALASWTKNGVVVGSRNTIEVTVGTDANDYVANFADESTVTIVKDYTISSTTGELTNDGTSATKFSQWASKEEPVLKLNATCGETVANSMSIVNDVLQLYAYDYDKANGYTYTIKAPDGYLITSYSLTYYMSSSFNITVSNGTTTQTASKSDQTLSASDLFKESASFTLTGTAANNFVKVRSFTVTIQKEGTNVTSPPTTYTITATADPGTAGSVTGGGTYDEGATVTLTATANSGYTFKNWTNNLNTDVVTNNPYTVTATADVTYTANFQEAAPTTYTITATADPATAGSVTGGGTYNEGATVTLTATANSGYTFKNWTSGTTIVSTNATYSFTANATAYTDLVANFEEETTTTTDLSGRYFRLKTLRSNEYMNILDYEDHNGAFGGVNVTALDVNNNDQIFYFTKSGESYKLKSLTDHYLYNDFSNPGYWNVNANSTSDSECMLLTFEPTTEELQYLISCTKGYFMSGPVASGGGGNGSNYVYCDTPEKANADTWLLEEVKYTITATANPADGGTANVNGENSVEVTYNGSATLTATANDGYNFVNWTKGTDIVSTEATVVIENITANADYVANFEEAAIDLSGKYYRLKVKNTSNYMNIANNDNNTSSTSGIITAAKETNKDAQIFYFTKSIDGYYKLQARTGYYITCHAWNANANSNSDGTELTFEPTGNELEYLIKWDNKNMNNGVERDDYFKVENNYVYCDAASTAAATWVLEEVTLHDVAVTANPSTAGTATITVPTGKNDKVEHGTSITLTATANSGYNFTGWYNGENLVTDANPYTFDLEGDISYEARFEQDNSIDVLLTDEQGNNYRDRIQCDKNVNAVKTALLAKYPFIELDNNGVIEDNTFKCTVTLPFKVSNSEKTYWHNIYWPTGTNNSPVYMSALNGTDQYVSKVTENAAYGSSSYNTSNNNSKISWAIYSVNESLEFKFKNELTGQFIKVTSVADGNAQNTEFVADEAEATVFTLIKDTGSYNGDYSITAKVDGTTGYLCSTSALEYDYTTFYQGNSHQGAWVIFTEADYTSKIMDLSLAINLKFGAGEGKYIINDDIQEIITALEDAGNIKLNDLIAHGITIEDAINNWPKLQLAISPANSGTTSINGEDGITSKYAPVGYEMTVTATALPGYIFANWTNGTEEASSNTAHTFTLQGATNLTANFDVDNTRLTIATNVETIGGGEGGTVTGAGDYAPGSTVTLSATPSGTNYRFMGWYNENGEQVSTAATYDFTATTNVNYTAKFIKQVFVKIIQPKTTNETGIVYGYGYAVTWIGDNITLTSTTVDYGTEVKIEVDVYDEFNSDVEFAYWSIDDVKISQENPYTFTATEDRYEFLANFNLKATLAVEAGDNGSAYIGTEGTTSKEVVTGNTYTISAKANSGYAFECWVKVAEDTDTVSYSAVYTFKLTAELNEKVTYKAYFKKITKLEDGKAYRIKARMYDGSYRYIYRDGENIKWKNAADDTNNSIFIAQYDFTANDGSLNLISAVGDLGWNSGGKMGEKYVAIKTVAGTVEGTFTLYGISGTEYRSYTALSGTATNTTGDNIDYYTSNDGSIKTVVGETVNGSTDFIFEEVPFEFNVGIANGSNAKLGTINLPFATTVHPSIIAYTVTGSDENYAYVAPLTLENNILPANTPVLVEAEEAGAYGFAPAPASNTVYETGFAGTLGAKEIADEVNAYILSYKGAGTAIKLYKLASNDRTINANKAYYIDETGNSSAISFKFIGTTDINGITDADSNVEGIYDLQGRKLDEITEPGIYIVNGKKILVK